jgi:hypothetical protein
MKRVPGVSPDCQRQPCTPGSKPQHGSVPKHDRPSQHALDSLVMRGSGSGSQSGSQTPASDTHTLAAAC